MRSLALINRQSGTVRQRGEEAMVSAVLDALKPLGAVAAEVVDGKDLEARIKKAVKAAEADVLVLGGGDGSVTTAASLLRGTNMILAPLPMGTFNMFVKALGYTPDVDAALAQMATAQQRSVDTAEVNGQVFLHQVSFGIQPRMARLRERMGYGSRLTKMLTGAVAGLMVVLRPRLLRFVIEQGDAPDTVVGQAVLVSNNLYAPDRPMLPGRLDGGVLGVYSIFTRGIIDYVRIAIDFLHGDWKQGEAVKEKPHSALTLKPRGRRFSRHRPAKLLATVDGELTYLAAPAQFKITPRSLVVLAPRSEA